MATAVQRKELSSGGAAGLLGHFASLLAKGKALGGGDEGGDSSRREPLPLRPGTQAMAILRYSVHHCFYMAPLRFSISPVLIDSCPAGWSKQYMRLLLGSSFQPWIIERVQFFSTPSYSNPTPPPRDKTHARETADTRAEGHTKARVFSTSSK